MTVRDVANWLLDQSAWWLLAYVVVTVVVGILVGIVQAELEMRR